MSLDQKTPFKLIASCIHVKGAIRSSICDLQRGDVKLIPNDLYKILVTYEGKNLKQIKQAYHHKYDTTIDEYFQFLLDNEFILFTTTPELFPKMSMDWYAPNEITHAILDIGKDSNYDIHKALKDLNKLHCKHIEMRFFRNVTLAALEVIVQFLDTLQSSILSIDFTIPYSNGFDTETMQDFLINFPRVSSFRMYGAAENTFIPPIDVKRGYIIYSKNILKSEKCCGVIDPGLFSINIKTFTESLQHNSCLHGKTAIDVDGNIKNCPSMQTSFGSIEKTSISEAIRDTSYKQNWNVTKDQIQVCRDCEFRHICTDCRAYIENPKNPYSKPLKCGYDPYTNTWEDWYKNPVKETVIHHYELHELQ